MKKFVLLIGAAAISATAFAGTANAGLTASDSRYWPNEAHPAAAHDETYSESAAPASNGDHARHGRVHAHHVPRD